jgi:hypothetical protein
MRQIFTSTRLENVESVEKMLNDAGIETKITQGRSWKGNSRREFSYSAAAKNHDTGQQPAVWVIKSDDFKLAREILHGAGLLEATRDASYLPEQLQFRAPTVGNPARRVTLIRMALLAGVAIAFGVMMFRIFLR